MQMEEAVFFPLADQLLTPADWRTIEAELSEGTNPIFVAQITASFGTVREQLLAWEAEDQLEIAQGGVS